MCGRSAGFLWPPCADRRQEADEVLALPVSCPSWLECVAQEIERHVFMTLPASGIFAVDDPGLLGMKLQTALGKALPDRLRDRRICCIERGGIALMVWTPPDGIDVPRWWC